jgi:hypothetical protein
MTRLMRCVVPGFSRAGTVRERTKSPVFAS